MKNDPTPPEPSGRGLQETASEPWLRALRLLDADLRRRGMAERTRRAYGIDAGQLAVWCTRGGIEPAEVTPRVLRRYAQVLSERRAGPATTARKLAALRQLYRALHEHGEVAANPADLVPVPKRPAKLPRVLEPAQISA